MAMTAENNVTNFPAPITKKPRATRQPKAKTVAPIVEKPKRAKREKSETKKTSTAKIENSAKPSRTLRRILVISQNAQTRLDASFAFVFGALLSVLAWLSMHHAHDFLLQHAGSKLTFAICIGAFAISGVKVYSYALGAADFGNKWLNTACAFGTVLLLDGLSAFGPGYVSIPCMVTLALVNGLSQSYVMTKNSPVLEKKKGRKKSA